MKKETLILHLFSLLISLNSHAVMVATLQGHESDLRADGRKLHVIVAGYGGEMGHLTYEMAVSRANKLKRDFPGERVVIVGSTPQKEGAINRFSPMELERKYNITLGYRSPDKFSNLVNDQRPLTGDYLAGVVMNLVTHPNDRKKFLDQNPNVPNNVSAIRQAVSAGQIPLASKIGSMDFMTHSSPISGIFLHDTDTYFHPTNSQNQGVVEYLSRGGMAVDEYGVLRIVNRDQALRSLEGIGFSLNSENKIVNSSGEPSSIRFNVEENGVKRRYSVDGSGHVFESRGLKGGAESRMLDADSNNFHYLNGLFSEDAYVNVSGCSSGYGLIDGMSKVLGVPVNGSATGSLVEVMDKNGDFFYNYPASNPYGDGELSESKHGSRNHELSPGDGRSVVGLRVDQRLYHGYWGNLKSGTNFVTSSCQIRREEPQATEDRKRCEMGMARSMEDALTSTTVNLRSGEMGFDDFTNVLIERMCPGGYSDRGYISESSREVNELNGLREGCVSAIRSLSYLNKYCSDRNPQFINRLFAGEVVSDDRSCRQEAQAFVQKHRFFVPLTDRLGKTLFCTLESGCEVQLKGCEITPEEESHCIGLNSNKESQEYKACMISKRCTIDEGKTRASNDNNPTFMKFIQNYMNGFGYLNDYRRGRLGFVEAPMQPVRLDETESSKKRRNSDYTSSVEEEIFEAIY